LYRLAVRFVDQAPEIQTVRPERRSVAAQVDDFRGLPPGGGEMGEMIRAQDWSSTPLGPMSSWPQSLITALGLILHSPIPITMLWGPDGVMLYNDAYSVIAGRRHPALLGSKIREGWPEHAAFNDNVMKVGLAGATLAYRDREMTLNRNGFLEQAWFNLDYSPVFDENGRPAGVIAIVVETTGRVLAERRRAFFSALSDRLREISDPLEVIVTAAEELGRYLKAVRAGYGEVFGEGAEAQVVVERDWSAEGLISVRGTHRLADYGGAIVDDLAAGRAVILRDMQEDDRTRGPIAQAYAALGVRSVVFVPLIKHGRFAAALLVCAAEPRTWSEDEVLLIGEVAERTWSSVERARAETSLAQSETRLLLATQAAKLGVFEWRLDSDEFLLSDRAKEIWGFPPDAELTFDKAVSMIHPEDAAQAVERSRRGRDPAVRDATPHEFRIIRADGAVRWIRSYRQAVFDEDAPGGPRALHYIGVVEDITERRLTQMRLRDSETRLRLAMDAGHMAVWEHDSATGRLLGSPELYAILGWPLDKELDLEALSDRYYPGDRERMREIGAAAVQRGERFFQAEFRFMRGDGALRWHLLRAEVTLDANGAPARTFGVILDITEQKRLEDNLRERESELEAALDAGKLAIFDIDLPAGTAKPSPRLNAFYGFPPDHRLTVSDFQSRYHPQDADRIKEQSARERADPTVRELRRDIHLLLPDGRARWAEVRGEYIRDPEERVVRARGVVLDVTERKQWEQRQQLLVDELNHRVKNTLAIVQGLAHQSLREGVAPAEAKTKLEARLSSLATAHNLLTSRSWEETALLDVVKASVAATAGSAADRVSITGPQVMLRATDAVSFALAVHELCTNAIKYGALSTSNGLVRVDWSLQGPDGELTFTWRERGGPPVKAPSARGFGTRMIERGLAAQLGGKASLSFDPDGLTCSITAPAPGARAFGSVRGNHARG
jgi:PAS domain S-box-containing protein